MKIDIDEIIDRVMGWHLELTLGGQTYQTRAPQLQDILFLTSAIKTAAQDSLNLGMLSKAIASMLVDADESVVPKTDPVRLLAVATAICAYTENYISKKAGVIADQVRTVITKEVNCESGNFTPR